ncbi:MAG: hypothetical protein M1823_003763 [Watsoniomyces obsoletus]|nr:MAG: hypothetical protein M1823_003763 [Watsoniomyces obsoletus]
MPGSTTDAPAVSLSFANNFWGKEDAGVHPLLERMHAAKVTSDEVKAFYNARSAIEDEYARKLLSLCRKPLGSSESGTLRASLDTVRGEVEAMGKAHQNIASQMKSELEEPLAAHAGGMKERRKIVQNGIEKLLKLKIQQTQAVNKSRDRYEQDCLRIKGYLAQGHMVMGQEERKNKAKLEKTQIHLATSSNEYEHAVKALEETTVRWNREWKHACDKFQDLEEERLDFMKSSLWNFANIASTVCVSDDASCEKIRLALEGCEVEKDIGIFIREKGTGQEIPDAPKYINFCRGDVNDTQSEASEDEGYSVAQFQRTINPAFRTSSPQPSPLESHHDPMSTVEVDAPRRPPITPESRETTVTPQKLAVSNAPPPTIDYQMPTPGSAGLPPTQLDQLPTVPHNAYPMDGMTMYCRTAPPSDRSSAASPGRPVSADSQSEYSNPTSFSSYEPSSGKQSPTKLSGPPQPTTPIEEQVAKKKSGFFQNRSPFRRNKSKHERENRIVDTSNVTTPSANRTGGLSSTPRAGNAGYGSATQSSSIPVRAPQGMLLDSRHPSRSPEPVDPRANFQLNVGNNVFDVASPDARHGSKASKQANHGQDELDPIAQALAELKGVGKQSSVRMSADRYHGIQTPAPSVATTVAAPVPSTAPSSSPRRNTPPPSYEQPAKRLEMPQPAFTSAAMQQTRQKYLEQKQSMFGGSSTNTSSARGASHARSQSRPGTSGSQSGHDVPRAVSPMPKRSVSPRPEAYKDPRQREGYRSMSPNPYQRSSVQGGQQQQQQRPSQSRSPQKRDSNQGYFSKQASPTDYRRRGSADVSNTQIQLAPGPENPYDASPTRTRHGAGGDRPMTYYGGSTRDGYAGQQQQQPQQQRSQADSRGRSRSINDGQQFTQEGRPILHHARAMYKYQASIPVELSFNKGEVLAILRHQEDGWWEAEAIGKKGRPGLVPSNYMQAC